MKFSWFVDWTHNGKTRLCHSSRQGAPLRLTHGQRSMAISPDHRTLPRFRFRVSTALVCFGLIFLPWATYLFDRPNFLDDKAFAAAAFNFVVYDFSVQVMFFGFVVAFGSMFWFAYKRHWRAVLQASLEMVVSFGAFILLPAY